MSAVQTRADDRNVAVPDPKFESHGIAEVKVWALCQSQKMRLRLLARQIVALAAPVLTIAVGWLMGKEVYPWSLGGYLVYIGVIWLISSVFLRVWKIVAK